ncbi:MAG: sigma-70 family RNA polymerase sigma factor, partial [Planctomycetia bacterium]|nr:sigma-70 family RNA polymerase sigma factor [Planctomycetia bacterium]
MAYGQLGTVLQHLRRLLGAQEGADLTDAQLLARFRDSRDEAAFAALVQRHGPLVLNVCRRVLGNADDADDAFQAVFLVLARKAGSIRRHESLGSWLYGVAYRVALRARSNAARRRSHEREAESMSPATADSRAAWDELRPILDEELNRLPEKYRTSIVLRYLQGKSNEQAAREAGCPAGTMSWRLAHGLDLLRQRLDRRGVALPASGLAVLLSEHAASAALSPPLSAAALQAALSFTAGQTAGISLAILTLAEGALKAMFLTKLKLTLALLLAVSVAGLGAGWVSWNLLGQGTPTALAVPLPDPKPAPPRHPADKAVSEPVVANEAVFRLETDAVWWLPPVDGKRDIPLALRIENQSKQTRQFSRWRGNVVLLAADGTPLQYAVHSSRGVRRLFETDALEQGKQLTATEPVRLNRGTKALSLSWTDVADTPAAFLNLKPGKYRVALQYTVPAGAANQWSGDVTTKPVEIEIRESP